MLVLGDYSRSREKSDRELGFLLCEIVDIAWSDSAHFAEQGVPLENPSSLRI